MTSSPRRSRGFRAKASAIAIPIWTACHEARQDAPLGYFSSGEKYVSVRSSAICARAFDSKRTSGTATALVMAASMSSV